MTQGSFAACPEMTDKKQSKKEYLFVCTGNTCRSPMAAALFNHLFGDGDAHASSAGIAAGSSPISEKAKNALMKRGVLPTPNNDYRKHISRQVSEDILSGTDLVICLTSAHAMRLIMAYPAFASKIAVMPRDISDPYGGSEADYECCLSEIEKGLAEAFGSKNGDVCDE